MIKERAWPVRAMYILIAAALAMSLMIMVAPAHQVSAACGDVKAEWDRVPTPDVEQAVLAPDSIIYDYAVASGGDVAYAIFYTEALNSTDWPGPWFLAKSEDGAATWKDITKAVKKEISKVLNLASADNVTKDMFDLWQVATDGADPDFLAVGLWIDYGAMDSAHVFISKDGGDTFKDTDKDGVTGIASLGEIYDLAVSPEVGGDREIAIAGYHGSDSVLLRSTVTAGTAGSWEDATAYDGWDDKGRPTAFNSIAVIGIQFSPDWAQDKSLLVVTIANEGHTVHLQTGTWGETETEGWNSKSVAGIDAVKIITTSAVLPPLYNLVAGMTLPSDYSAKSSDKRYAWVWVNYIDDDSGDPACTIFLVKNKKAEPVGPKGQIEDEGLWLTDISYQGTIAEGKAIAGVLGTGTGESEEDLFTECCTGVQVYRNNHISNMDICCYGWEAACKPPTGRFAMDAFYVSDDKAYAVALYGEEDGDEGAWSVSFDDGDTWNQLSLIDTYIDYLSDVAVSPDCNKTMLVSVNVHKVCIDYSGTEPLPSEQTGCDSVWVYADEFPELGYSEYSGHWLRTYCFRLTDNPYNAEDGFWNSYPERGLLRLAPADAETTGDTVYLVDRGTSTVYWNEEETLACWNTGSAVKIPHIVDLAVKDATTIYALGDDGYIAMSDDYARGWHTTVDTEVTNGWTIAVHGDEDVLVGGQNGKVSYSSDGGETFALLEKTPKEFDGLVTVAFDSYFDTNNMIYAALAECNDDNDNGIYRWVIGTSDKWVDMGALPYDYTGLVLSYPNGNTFTNADTGGVLYASYIGAHNASDNSPSCDNNVTWMTGVARSLNPGKSIECLSCVEWDYLTVGLTGDEFFRMVPDALKSCGCMDPTTDTKLFAIGKVDWEYDMDKAQDFTVWMFEDCYAKKAPEITYPADGDVIPADPCSCYNAPFSITWDCLCDACYYEVQYDLDQAFSSPKTIEITPTPGGAATSYLLPGGEAAALLSCETTYYMRIRASKAGTCQVIHSQWSDAIEITVAPSVGAAAINLISPAPGATGVAIKNVGFSWDLTATADAFNWVLSANADLSSALDSQTGLTHKAYTYTGTLTHGTTYYWQVTAYNKGAVVSTSAVGTFTTGATGPFCDPVDGLCFDTQAELEAHEAAAHHVAGTPAWVWVVIAIGAVLVIVVIVLIFRTRRV